MSVEDEDVKDASRRSESEKKPRAKAPKPAGKATGSEGEAFRVEIGTAKLTKYEKARIIGARALQISLGAPPFVNIDGADRDPIPIATKELNMGVLPISIRRTLPDGRNQDIPLQALL
ncbi:MAG: DNA-directed RNA polymerase subunit K [Thaumarchaeota archaeon]|nr:DNA-directed RNA polymerase subunit K [Nitrososphaerota archaeon]